jgi:hypothetical protein
MRSVRFLLLSFCITSLLAANGTTGKISGTVTDAKTNEKLFGVSILLEGTSIGAATDADGYYTIINVPPGMYRLRASYVGYAPMVISNVRVDIDQTTTIDIALQEQVISGQEVVVIAQRPVVQKDVSSSRANITSQEIGQLPVTQVASVVGLQAGVQGLSVRGSGSDQLAFVVNGFTLRDERDNSPYTAISVLAVQDIQVQTGGFNAEYGNIRSGVVNATTSEGFKDKYTFGLLTRYSPPARKYFGIAPNDPNSYWIRPFVDDAVAWTGTTSGAWDEWTQRQYRPFEGWNSVAQKLLTNNNPSDDLSPQAAQKLFLWQHRKNFNITKPDVDLDLTFGGPFPLISEHLANLRFFFSFRSTNTQYMYPLSRDGVSDWSANLKLTADVGTGMKLTGEYLMGRNEAVDRNQTGTYGSFSTPSSIANQSNRVSYIDARIFTYDYWGRNRVERDNIALKFTHVLSNLTFYEVSAQRFRSSYSTGPGRMRDTSRVYKFGDNFYVDEAPFGWFGNPGDYSSTGIDGLRMAIGMSNARDSSKLSTYTVKGDFESQINRYNKIKAGIEFTTTTNEVNYGSYDEVLPSGRSTSVWTTYPLRFSAYLQDKLEYEGMIANIGIRYDLSHAGGEWYDYDPFTKTFKGPNSYGLDTLLAKSPTDVVSSLSPRMGVAFPITENAKLFFNYGHFRSMPLPENLYLIRHETSTKDIIRLANPNLPLPKTVAYELGFEHNLFDQYLLRVAAYYKDVSNQSALVNYIGYNNVPNYSVTKDWSYEDIRGFELTLNKNRGDWFQGFINYTYLVQTSGNFGRPRYYQNPVDQKNDERTNPVISRPIPQPYGRMNLIFFTPQDFGPSLGGISLLGDIQASLLGRWSSGFWFTWVGGGSYPDVVNNIQWRDSYSLDARISKSFRFSGMQLVVFADINNLLNRKELTTYGFVDGADYDAYMKSLHLPADYNRFAYGNITGDDQPGDYRKSGVAYQPIVYTGSAANLTSLNTSSPTVRRAFYYAADEGKYYQYNTTSAAWEQVNGERLQRVLDDKAYIDMPNQDWFNFLDPRDIYFGLRLSIDLF